MSWINSKQNVDLCEIIHEAQNPQVFLEKTASWAGVYLCSNTIVSSAHVIYIRCLILKLSCIFEQHGQITAERPKIPFSLLLGVTNDHFMVAYDSC